MYDVKERLAGILTDFSCVDDDSVFSAYPDTVEDFPCIVFEESEQSDGDYRDNGAGGCDTFAVVHVFSKKLEDFPTAFAIMDEVYQKMLANDWVCINSREVADTQPDTEHRVATFRQFFFKE